MSDVIRKAIQQDERSVCRISVDAGVTHAVLSRFINGKRDLNMRTADKVCRALGLELRPVRKAGA